MLTSFLPKGRFRPQSNISGKGAVYTSSHFTDPMANTRLTPKPSPDQFVKRTAHPHFAGLKPGTILNMRHPNDIIDEDNNTWVHYAARAGKLDLMKKILRDWKDEVDLNAQDRQGLNAYSACAVTRKGDILKIAELLRDAGAPLQVFNRDFIIGYQNPKPFTTPSDLAKYRGGTKEMIKFFLEEEEKARKAEEPGILGRIFNFVTGFFF